MTEPGERLIVIPARGGSKRLPRKNVLPLAGKPLICWTIEAALAAGLAARIMVTSDDDEILAIASHYASRGLIVHKRPAELASDNASTADALQDALDADQKAGFSAKMMVVLQPTSPLRTAEDILAAVTKYEEGGSSETVVSVCEVDHPTAWIGTIAENGQLLGLDLSGKRSQDFEKEYRLNGAVYVASVNTLRQRGNLFTDSLRASVMPRVRSVDIDEELDLQVCRFYLSNLSDSVDGKT